MLKELCEKTQIDINVVFVSVISVVVQLREK